MMQGGGMGGGFFGTGLLFMLLIVAIVGVFVWMMRGKTDRSTHHTNRHSLGLLKERLAKGEITEEEYERLKRKVDE